jgi:hypothetical protein
MSQRGGVKVFAVKTRRVAFGATALLCAGLCGVSVNAQVIAKVRWHYAYHIGVGDILEISVSERPELSGVVVVSESGEVSLPWHKAIKVAGLSVEATAALVRQELQSVKGSTCLTFTVNRKRSGSWVPEQEPYFTDVPPPAQTYATRTRDS